MIKRNGVEVMNERTGNVKLAKETIEVCKQKRYTSLTGNVIDIAALQEAAVQGTVLYQDEMPDKEYVAIKPTIEVVNETTAVAGARLSAQGKDVAVLNFASARNQGGGFLSGALAQEEDLCRASGLYACIKTKPIFYNENILCEHNFYTDNVIYSPKVPFFRNQYNLFLDDPFTLSVISAPAPNVRAMGQEVVEHEAFDNTIFAVILERARKILQIAEAHGHTTIVLGAWGCGAFGNDSRVVASAFLEALNQVPTFEHVCFAVYDTREPPVLYEAFKEACDSIQASGT